MTLAVKPVLIIRPAVLQRGKREREYPADHATLRTPFVVCNLLKMLTCNLALGSKVSVQNDEGRGNDTEDNTKTNHDGKSDTLGQRRFTSEEGVLSGVFIERRSLNERHFACFTCYLFKQEVWEKL